MTLLVAPGRAAADSCPRDIGPSAQDRARRAFAEAWAGNAAHYEAQGLYGRLARLLADQGEIGHLLDIGCGLGHGIAALRLFAGTGRSIVGIDENPHCLGVAARRLQVGVTLFASDVLRRDAALHAALGRIDTITLWFVGTHEARLDDPLVKAARLTSDELYGIAVELAALHLAAERLAPGGLIQIACRAAHADPETILDAYRPKLRAMAAELPLELIDLRALPYAEPASGNRIPVGSAALDRAPGPTFAVSAIFRRR